MVVNLLRIRSRLMAERNCSVDLPTLRFGTIQSAISSRWKFSSLWMNYYYTTITIKTFKIVDFWQRN